LLSRQNKTKGIQLESFSPAENQIIFDLAVYTPNLFDIPISGIEDNITLNPIAIGNFVANNTENTLKSQRHRTVKA